MNSLRDNLFLTAVTLVLATVWGVAWIAVSSLEAGGPLVRAVLLAFGVSLIGVVSNVMLRHANTQLRTARRAIESLLRLDPSDLEDAGAILSSLPASHPWRDVVSRLELRMVEQLRALSDIENERVAMELRGIDCAKKKDHASMILESLSDPVLVVDQYGELALANSAAERLFGFDGGGAEQRAVSQLVRCEKLMDLLHKTERHKVAITRQEDLEISLANGESRWHRVTATSFTGGDNNNNDGGDAHAPQSGGAVLVLRDLSTEKASQQRNAQFVSAVSHEMKTPLAGIKAYVELLVDGDATDEETREEFLDVINGQADRLKRLIDNLLNLSRIESGVVQVKKQVYPVNEILDEAARVVRPGAEEKQIELNCDLSPMCLNVLADRDQILQAAINLLSNAIKYTPEGGKVTLRSRSLDTQVQFEVEDTGIGLSEEDCHNVFEKFYRVQKDRDMAPGTGLGLPLAKSIVEEVHGGCLSVKSSPGKGSTFTVTLPGAAELS